MVKILRRDELTRRLAVVVGTRPGIVKMSAVIRELGRRRVEFELIHTGQHYSPELDAVFFEDLELPSPDVQLPSLKDRTTHATQMADMLIGLEQVLVDLRPMAVLVGGDANTNLAAALAARKLNIQVCHDEAGLRSYDWLMPEEHNRVMMDHIAEFLFAPNENARAVLEREQVRGRVTVTGSTIVDAVDQNRGIAERRSTVLAQLDVAAGEYALMTTHHEETVDYPDTLRDVVQGCLAVADDLDKTLVFPVHPRTRNRLIEFGLMGRLQSDERLRMTAPLGYLDFLTLHAHAALTLTDSGGVIQEAAILGVPCVTLGRVTEWQEVVDAGANFVAGTSADEILTAARVMLRSVRDWENPFGSLGAAARIVDVIQKEVLSGEGFIPPRPTPGKQPAGIRTSDR